MSIGRNEIMHIARASARATSHEPRATSHGPRDDAWVMWLIIGGWAFVVAVLNCLSELQALFAR